MNSDRTCLESNRFCFTRPRATSPRLDTLTLPVPSSVAPCSQSPVEEPETRLSARCDQTHGRGSGRATTSVQSSLQGWPRPRVWDRTRPLRVRSLRDTKSGDLKRLLFFSNHFTLVHVCQLQVFQYMCS
jgi:hypothetical protein